MPLFEYLCETCNKVSDFLEKADTRDKHTCPHCGGSKMTKRLSGFAVGRSGCSDSKPCGGCRTSGCPHAE